MKTIVIGMYKIIVLLYLIVYSSLIESQTISSGLHFSSYTVNKEARTSLEISPRFDATDGFTLDFDIKLRPETHNYGYVFRIIIDDERSFDLIANFSLGRQTLNLIEGNNIYLAFEESKLASYQWNKWAHIRCTIAPDDVKLSFDKETLQGNYEHLKIKNVKIYFGYSGHPQFHSSDVPPMTIRNVRITDSKANPVAFWPLKEHLLHSCLDSIRDIPAQVSNATWEINKHTKWVKEQTLKLPVQTQICNAPGQNSIYFANSTFTLKYSLADNTLDTLYHTAGTPYVEKNNQLIYHPGYDELWSYDFDNQKAISRYDFRQQSWSNTDYEIKNPEYSQHNAFISPKDSCLYVFGGYGNYQYKNKILKKSRLQDDWSTVSYKEEISPRYLGGMGFKNQDSLLIFGGCGNPSGKQELGVVNYYDLYALDILTFKTKKLWSISNNTDHFVVGNNIVTDEKNNKLYALCYPNDCSNNYILLRSFNLNDGGDITNYADTIPFTFNDVNSFCTLYYDSLQSRLYAVTNYNHNNESDVNIYSLAYPPLTLSDTLQTVTEQQSKTLPICILSGICLLIGAGGIYTIRRKKKKAGINIAKTIVPTDNHSQPESVLPPADNHHSATRNSSILFLNGFQVWNRDGKDITKSFTPILKQLLILIILYTEDNKKGISNVTLRELLWFDKMDESAQNNRRVNIRKLKLLLEQLDGVELVKENTYWSIQFTQTYCDYREVCTFINRMKDSYQITEQNIHHIPLELLSGQLLPYIQTDWLDHFKSDYSNSVLDIAIKLSRQEYIKENNELLVQIANIMFAHDQTDENALILKCRALYKNGRTGLAKSTFDTFCNEYKTTLNSEYKKSFNEIINEVNQ